MDQHSIPAKWKHYLITPIPKTGNSSYVENCRPISLLCVTSKVLELLIYNKFIDFNQPKLSSSQYGFLKNRSCLTQLLTSLSSIYCSLDIKSSTDVIFLDLQKAFNKVPHSEFLFKMELLWFRSYLSDRIHSVKLDGVIFPSLPVISGVPQDSILGPLVFLIYVNDIPTYINHSRLFMFAYDTKYLKSIEFISDAAHFQCDTDSLFDWSRKWRLEFNHSAHVFCLNYCILNLSLFT